MCVEVMPLVTGGRLTLRTVESQMLLYAVVKDPSLSLLSNSTIMTNS